MVIKVMALRPELTERLLPLASGLEGQGLIIDSLVHWASEWDIAQRFSEQESLTLPNEIARLRRELAGCVFLYAHYYQSGYAALE